MRAARRSLLPASARGSWRAKLSHAVVDTLNEAMLRP
jgi:hypothetical protein